jgi:hypothetical protein
MVDDSSRAEPQDDGSPSDEGAVEHELGRLRGFAQDLSLDDLRRGAWLAKLLKFSLDSYVRDVDAAYLTAKYPGLPVEAVVRARIQLAARYAGIEGALSAGAYTGAVAATIGTVGGASPLTLPAASLSFVLDLVFTSQLQLRLAHDIAVLYRVPLDLSDPEDLWKLIRVAFAIKGGEAGRGAIGKGVPVLVRPVLEKIFSGGTLAATKSLPLVGKYLLQRNVVKFAIPAVGVPLSAAVNHWATRVAGAHAAQLFRSEGRIVEAARRMTERTVHHSELLWVLWLIIKSDALIHENERLLLKHVTALVADPDSELRALSALRTTVDVEPKRVWAMLSAATGDLVELYDAGVVAAAVDGTINVNELTNLRTLADCCGVPYDEDAIRAAARASR